MLRSVQQIRALESWAREEPQLPFLQMYYLIRIKRALQLQRDPQSSSIITSLQTLPIFRLYLPTRTKRAHLPTRNLQVRSKDSSFQPQHLNQESCVGQDLQLHILLQPHHHNSIKGVAFQPERHPRLSYTKCFLQTTPLKPSSAFEQKSTPPSSKRGEPKQSRRSARTSKPNGACKRKEMPSNGTELLWQ